MHISILSNGVKDLEGQKQFTVASLLSKIMFVAFCVNWEDGDGDISTVVLEGDLRCSEVGILGCDDRTLGKYGMT